MPATSTTSSPPRTSSSNGSMPVICSMKCLCPVYSRAMNSCTAENIWKQQLTYRSSEKNPNEPAVFTNRAQGHIFLRALPEGLDDVGKCIELDPTYLVGYTC
ncbi:hypothetical protein VPH35_127259 [Triticum aestivum]